MCWLVEPTPLKNMNRWEDDYTIYIWPHHTPRISKENKLEQIWGWVKTLVPSEPQNSWDLWMFIPLKIGIYRLYRYWPIPISRKRSHRLFSPVLRIPSVLQLHLEKPPWKNVELCWTPCSPIRKPWKVIQCWVTDLRTWESGNRTWRRESPVNILY